MMDKKKEQKSAQKVNSVVAGVAGAVIGGAAVATAMIMSNKKNQKKVQDAFAGAKDKVSDYVDSIKSQPIIKKSSEKIERVVNAIKK